MQTPFPPTPAEILQQLIRFDTTNPPGNEAACIGYMRDLLAQAGIPAEIAAGHPERPNLVARLPGSGRSAPLLLQGHLDVVTTAGQDWQVPPFEGRLQDGWLWGRGALDMKGPFTLFLAAFLKARAEGLDLPGDVLLCALTDEEEGSLSGARYLVERRPELFDGVKYAFGEFGGFNLSMMGINFYPIMVAEKQGCWIKATFRGPGGHGSIPVQGGAMAKAARALQLLDARRLPVHVTPAVRLMIERLAQALPRASGAALRGLLNPLWTDAILDVLGARGRLFYPLLHNTVSPTMLAASDKMNVIPSEVHLGLDGRLVPGFPPEQFFAELHHLIGPDFEIQPVAVEPAPGEPDMALFDRLANVLRRLDPSGVPIPYVMPGVTDARFFSKLGIQTYGFTPLQLPADFNFLATVHAANERIPVKALDFGVEAVYQALQIF